MEKEIEISFSQRWEIYRVAMHEKGGLHLVADMDTKYSVKQLYDMLEMLDVYDAMKKIAHEQAVLEAKQKSGKG